ncbi:MAG TPA: hypothetical protein VGY77_10935 [Gemmataceae bacterium]|nr:hypothetical protein [Gemmataceae bacterium]
MMVRKTTILTGFALLLIGFTIPWVGGTRNRPEPPDTARQIQNKQENLLATEAGVRWQSCQPTHWRSFMLQR